MRTVVLAAVSTVALGCATANQGTIRGTDTPPTRTTEITKELTARGYKCEVSDDKIEALCEHDDTYKIVLNSRSNPPRLFVLAYFGSKHPCNHSELQQRIAQANRQIDVQVACLENAQNEARVSFATLSLLPRSGVAGDELDTFLRFFSGLIANSLDEHKLREMVE